MGQYEGTVKWFNNAKGFGFLGREGEADVFVPLQRPPRAEGYKTLKNGDAVRFDVTQGDKGPQAANVYSEW